VEVIINLLRGHWLTIDGQSLVLVRNCVAGQTHDTLDVIKRGIFRVAKYHDIAPLRRVDINDLLVDHRQTDSVGELVDQDEIADQQGWNHGPGRNLERLEKKGAEHEYDQDDREEASAPLDPKRLLGVLRAQFPEFQDIYCVQDTSNDQQNK
jgi:hypothetical protein